MKSLKEKSPYALDTGVVSATSNIDIVLLSATIGPAGKGIYQAGQKLSQGAGALALVISNVHLPKLAYISHNQKKFRAQATKSIITMIACGTSLSALLLINPTALISTLYGETFKQLAPLIPLFAGLVFIRYVSGALGLILTAKGKQKSRVTANLLSLTILLIVAYPLTHQYGIAGMIYSQLIASATLASQYAAHIAKTISKHETT